MPLWLDKNRLTASGPLTSTVVRIWNRTPCGRPHKVDFVSLACLPSVFVQFICSVRHFFYMQSIIRRSLPIRVYTSLALRLRKRKLLTFVPGVHMHLSPSVSKIPVFSNCFQNFLYIFEFQSLYIYRANCSGNLFYRNWHEKENDSFYTGTALSDSD